MDRYTLAAHIFLLLVAFGAKLVLCAADVDQGWVLLRFKEEIEVDPYGALSNWETGARDPCAWFGVGCADDGKIAALRLQDLGLKGMLSPELGMLTSLKFLDIHNNSFYGTVPREIGCLLELEMLDLRNNELTGIFLPDFKKMPSLKLLLIKDDKVPDDILADDKSVLLNRVLRWSHARRMMSEPGGQNGSKTSAALDSPNAGRSSSDSSPVSDVRSPPASPQHGSSHAHGTSTNSSRTDKSGKDGFGKKHVALIVGLSVGIFVVLCVSIFFFRKKESMTVNPWRTGLSGQLHGALLAGVPSVGRTEIETACEGFSNVIGSLPGCELYKGTLSTGVEIAVVSTLARSPAEWSDASEEHFRNKIDSLSKMNHKNFTNFLGYCISEEPFTRMMLLEYAPNGTLFEHLHVKEAEHLSWPVRLRIVMGVIYCLEHADKQSNPVLLRSLNSSCIYLTDDYAAKISDTGLFSEGKKAEEATVGQEGVVYKYGILLLEVISGRLPFSEDDGLLAYWVSSYLSGKRPLQRMVDSTLASSVPDETLSALCDVVRSCINENPESRPTVTEIAIQMRNITSISPDAAVPTTSPLWWAEVQIMDSET